MHSIHTHTWYVWMLGAICRYTRIQRNVLLEVCIVYVYSELRVVSLAAGKAFVDGVDGDGVWILCSCVRSGRWAVHSDSQKGYGKVFTGVWYDHLEYVYIFMVFVELANALILLEISSDYTSENRWWQKYFYVLQFVVITVIKTE